VTIRAARWRRRPRPFAVPAFDCHRYDRPALPIARAAPLPLLCLSLFLLACRDQAAPDPAWVEIYDPAAAAAGYNLVLFQRRTPMLIDMNGNEVHRWPVKATARARLRPDGALLTIGTDGVVRELDWEGETTWEFRLPREDFPHHDLIALQNGNRLILAHDAIERLDYLLEVDAAGGVVWEWRAGRHLAADLERARAGAERVERNATHINSVHELPPNRWFDGGDQRFRPGNLLISARNLNTLYLLDRATGEVVWRYGEGLDRQHEASMIPRGFPGEGHIVFFNNGLQDRFAYRRSAVVEIDPVAGAEVWSYRAPNFFSSTAGIQQSLPNGNLLVASSRGGRVFELARDGRIVWQWTPSYLPMREHRYPYDYCPQLARLPRPRPRRIDSAGRRHVDRDLYDFALGLPTRRSRIDGRVRRLLATPNACRELLLPERAKLTVGYGFEQRPAGAAGEPPGSTTASIRLTRRAAAAPSAPAAPAGAASAARQESPAARILLERELAPRADGAKPGSIEEVTLDLSEFGLETVELCLQASAGGGPASGQFFWTQPAIRSSAAPREDAGPAGADAAQSAVQRKHLEALGYVD
jgi:Arylsulfotransferase (ASST)